MINPLEAVIRELKRQQRAITHAIEALSGIGASDAPARTTPGRATRAKRKGGMTPAGRKRLAEAMRRRWAVRANGRAVRISGSADCARRRKYSLANSAARGFADLRHLVEGVSVNNADLVKDPNLVRRARKRNPGFGAAAISIAAMPIVIGILNPSILQAQNAGDWQNAAGGKAAFEVASIKVSNPGTRLRQNFPLDPTDSFQDTRTRERPNGRFSAIAGLTTYIRFAWKLRLTSVTQLEAMTSRLPKWVSTDLFEIEARGPANATKDQMRLMMQALLAERFQLTVHFETPEVPVLAMTLVKAGKPGPGLRPHAEGPPCDTPASPNIFPSACYLAGWQFADSGGRETLSVRRKGSGRDLTMADIAGYLASWGSVDRPLTDRTGLTGEYDFTVQWKSDPNIGGGRVIPKMGSGPVVPAAPAGEPDSDGPSFIQALHDQLGLKLESTKGRIETLLIDHVERPSEN